MMARSCRWLWMIVLWAAVPALAQTTGTLQVLVVQAGEDLPVPGVELQLKGDDLIGGQQIRAADDDGGWVFDRLPPGTYQLQARKQGYELASSKTSWSTWGAPAS